MVLETIRHGVHRIEGRRSNIYLLALDELVLVDTGMPGDHGTILDALAQLGHAPRDVRRIFITHAHLDHIGSLAAMVEATGAKVVAGGLERPYIEGSRMLCSMPREGFGGRVFRSMLFLVETFLQRYRPVRLDVPVGETGTGDRVGDIRCIASPGHSAGSLSFLLEADGILITGDALSGNPEPRLPPRAGCSDYAQALRTAKQLAATDFDICLFGHGPPLVGRAASHLRRVLGT